MPTTTEFELRGDGPLVMVDDDAVDIMLFEHCHKRSHLDHRFVAFTSGEEFLQQLHSYLVDNERLPALVLLDINMPGMNGFEVLAALRAEEAFSEAPVVVFFSDSDNPEDRRRAAAYGTCVVEKFLGVHDGVAFLNELADRYRVASDTAAS